VLFLYNAGAREQEVADMRVERLGLGEHPIVRLHGKGGKWRTCPLLRQTAELLGSLLWPRPASDPQAPVFAPQEECDRRGEESGSRRPPSRKGILFGDGRRNPCVEVVPLVVEVGGPRLNPAGWMMANTLNSSRALPGRSGHAPTRRD
jgi:hypothetical protein